jgi:rifampicin phosphotransferase
MVDNFLVDLEQAGNLTTLQVGGKAHALGRLLAAGYPVPEGFVVLPAAFDENGLTAGAWDSIQLRLAAWRARQPEIAFAVRSSGAVEDGSQAAFAGEYATVLNTSSNEEIQQAIDTVYASRLRAMAYQPARHLKVPGSMAVVVQELMTAECSGVCDTVHPVGPQSDQMLVNAAWGLGSGVVNGTVPADTHWVDRRDLSESRQTIAAKVKQVVPDQCGGTAVAVVPSTKHAIRCLPEAWLRCISQFGLSLEQFFGQPQDVEWAIAADQLWILQSRPITTLPAQASRESIPIRWENEDDRNYFWWLWRLQPHKVLWPLEQDWLALASRTESEKRRRGGADQLGRGWLCNGRAYIGVVPNPEPAALRSQRRAEHAELEAGLRHEGRTIWEHYRPAIIAATERLRDFRAEQASGEQLARHLQEAIDTYHEHGVLHAAVWGSPLPLAAAYARVAGVPETEAQTALERLFVGDETALTRLIDALYNLAVTARGAPLIAELVANPPTDVMSRLAGLPEAAAFVSQLDLFLAAFGDRTGAGFGSEDTLCMPTLREQPDRMLRMAAPYLDPNVSEPAVTRQRLRAARDAQVEALCAGCDHAAAVDDFRRLWQLALKEDAVLEEHNYYIDQMAGGQLRRAILFAGQWLVEHGALDEPDAVFWLRFSEIFSALRTGEPGAFAEVIAARKEQHAEWEKLSVPPCLGRPSSSLPPRPPVADAELTPTSLASPGSQDNQLQGLGASAGLARGPARVLLPGSNMHNLRAGDILVAQEAGPLWTPHFPTLRGLILEQGSVGQHAAITAREYGIPAVINCRDAMRSIKDGDLIQMDGTTGIVTRIV